MIYALDTDTFSHLTQGHHKVVARYTFVVNGGSDSIGIPAVVRAELLRGRFDEGKITDRLAEYKYAKTEYKGQRYLARTGEDALLISSDAVIVYGQETAIKAAIDSIAYFPEITPIVDNAGHRRFPVVRYPYLVFYRVTESEILILHIRHASRRPIDPNRELD